MTIVETTVTISISEEGASLEELEAQIGAALPAAGRELLARACQAMEAALLEIEAPGVRRTKRRGRNLLTRFGWMQLERWQTWDPQRGYSCPLDRLLGLGRGQPSPWILQQAIALATRLPYRQATYLLSTFVGDDIDHRTLYRWVQKAGAAIVLEEDELQRSVFQHGLVPPRDESEREIILAEVDGTYLRAQREESEKFEVRLGVLTTGKALESRTAKHRRYRLQERIRYGGVEPAQDFGERLFLKGEAHLGLSRARHLLLVGDGAEWIEALAGHDRWRATYQLDSWHLTQALQRTFSEHPQLVKKLKKLFFTGRGKELIPAVRLAQLNHIGDPERVENLLTYLEANQGGFYRGTSVLSYGARSLRPLLSEKAKLVCVEGSGAVEKHIDLTLCRRFKGQGMRWTRKGANRLLKLRIQELDRAA